MNLFADWRADPDLNHAIRCNQTFINGVVENRSMAIPLAETFRPGVDMGIENKEPERSMAPG